MTDVVAVSAAAGNGNETTPLEEKKASSLVVSITEDVPVADSSPPPRGINRLTALAARLQLAITQPGAAPHFPEPSGDETAWDKFKTFLKFMGPGAIISVAYIDPDNFQTNIAAGASFQYKQLFMLVVAIVLAVYMQCMCVKLGSVTGLDLAQMNHRHLPRWLELIIYAFAETSIICADLSQVIGTAIAINILNNRIPTWAGCVISVVDTLLILLVYTPRGELRKVRIFEVFVGALVVTIFITICVTLGMVTAPADEVFLGFLPSKRIFTGTGLYESCAMLGGILMPHSLYVGGSLTRSRLYDYDTKNSSSENSDSDSVSYRPSIRAIRACMGYSIAELVFTLFTVGLVVNGALVIIAGSVFYNNEDSDIAIGGDIPGLYSIFVKDVAPAAGTLFAIGLLFSGMSAGIVATMAGQIIMEAAINIRLSPFLRRLVTRCIAIIPALIVAVSTGEDGLARALVACNYILALALIVITAPLLYYPCRNKFMTIADGPIVVSFKNSLANIVASAVVWAIIVFMNVATIVLLALGLTGD